MLLYPSLPMVGAEYFRLKNICDCQKELDNKIDQNKEVVKKQGRAKFKVQAKSITCGITFTFLSPNGLAVSVVLFTFLSTRVSVCSQRLERKISKHEKIMSLTEVKLLSISNLN